jgi:hypothetical protein
MFLSLSLAYKLYRSGNRVLLLQEHPLISASRLQYNIDTRMRPTYQVRLRKQYRSKTQRSRKSLYEKDLLVCREPAIDASHNHKTCKELCNLERKLGAWVDERPQEAGSQEAIVETLISGHVLRFGGEVGLECKCFQACGLGPEEHLQSHDVDVEGGEQEDGDGGEERHAERETGAECYCFW